MKLFIFAQKRSTLTVKFQKNPPHKNPGYSLGDSGPGQQLHSQSSPGERNGSKFSQNGKLGHSCTNMTKGKLYGSRDSDHAIVHLGLNVSSSANNCGCVLDGGN